jgi:hypothetical protein
MIQRFLSSLCLVSVLLVGWGCETPSSTSSGEVTQYVDVKGFIEQQQKLLQQRKPLVKKAWTVGKELEEKQTSEIDWETELALFEQADINKPAYARTYTVQQGADGRTWTYEPNASENVPVRLLKVTLDSAERIEQLEAELQVENNLYTSQKLLRLTCAEREGIWQIVSYSINGSQQLRFMQPKVFEVSGVL